jgi:hypothetical protein
MKKISILLFLLICAKAYGQILTFDFVGNLGTEVTDVSNFNDPNLTNSTISRGVGITPSANADRFGSTGFTTGGLDATEYLEFTITPNAGFQFSVSSIVVHHQRSGTGPVDFAIRSNLDGYTANLATVTIADITTVVVSTFTFAQANSCASVTYRIYAFTAEAGTGTWGPENGAAGGNDIIVNGTTSACAVENCSDGIDNDGDGFIDGADPDCAANTIITGVISGSPFTVTCSAFQTISVPFTTTGTYNAGNIFTAQLSDATGSFAFPLTIGTLSLSGTGVSGSIPSTILAGVTAGAAYRIRVVSSNPATTGSDNGSNLTINNAGSPCNGPLIVNEVSQGSSGVQEYIEVLVVGNNPCGTIDIRNMIIDDNNGDFSGGPVASTGIAGGHLRFTNSGQWANVPSGSLIVIYNNLDVNPSIPADDVSDLLVPDKVYVLPANSSFLEGCSTLPLVGNASYTPCTYGAGVWTYMGLANAADAAQTRLANGAYNHGVSWGGAPMDGGPDGLNIGTTSASGQLIEFENTVDNDYTNSVNFTRSSAPADETPGAPNSINNAVYISSLTCLTLPVELLRFNIARIGDDAMLTWVTGSEINCSHFIVERSGTDMEFVAIGKVEGNGTTNIIHEYGFLDPEPLKGLSYYRLRQVDFDGQFEYSTIKPFQFEISDLSGSNFNGSSLTLAGCDINATVQVFNSAGGLLLNKKGKEVISLDELAAGYYIVRIICGSQYFNLPISKPR